MIQTVRQELRAVELCGDHEKIELDVEVSLLHKDGNELNAIVQLDDMAD